VSRGRQLRAERGGGAILDVILGFGVILVGAYLLYQVGLTFHALLFGAERFFGL
jgi:hypothetical protein